jgi:hypothetical protein
LTANLSPRSRMLISHDLSIELLVKSFSLTFRHISSHMNILLIGGSHFSSIPVLPWHHCRNFDEEFGQRDEVLIYLLTSVVMRCL